MKIFISHSSRNANYGNALVNLLTGVGISGDHIIFTSNDAYGIPIGQNIFEWLKNRITEKPYVLYLLSPEYYKSVSCLNEMGAAWVIENKHTMIFTPDFKLDSYEFQNGAIDPREIGFFIDNFDKLIAFIDSLRSDFNVTNNHVLISQKIREFIESIKAFSNGSKTTKVESVYTEKNVEIKRKIKEDTSAPKTYEGEFRFFEDLINNKLKEEEILLIHYVIDQAKFKLYTGWQVGREIEKIQIWEDINGINHKLSTNYESALRRLEMKKLVKVIAFTGSGNPKEMQITEEFQNELMNLHDDFIEKINETIEQNPREESEQPKFDF